MDKSQANGNLDLLAKYVHILRQIKMLVDRGIFMSNETKHNSTIIAISELLNAITDELGDPDWREQPPSFDDQVDEFWLSSKLWKNIPDQIAKHRDE